jgi:hypothetical protein
MFGAVNSLFSALAFAGVIYTILLQREELALQRLELEQTRQELARAATAQEASERMLAKQASAQEASARLTALTTMIGHYSELERSDNLMLQLPATTQREEYVRLLEAELRSLVSSTRQP